MIIKEHLSVFQDWLHLSSIKDDINFSNCIGCWDNSLNKNVETGKIIKSFPAVLNLQSDQTSSHGDHRHHQEQVEDTSHFPSFQIFAAFIIFYDI